MTCLKVLSKSRAYRATTTAAVLLTCLMFSGNTSSIATNLPSCSGTYWNNCFGAFTYEDGTTYIGEWKKDQRSGQGTYTYPNGEKYVGEFKDDKANGQGTLTFSSGTKYVGEFKDDKANGQGTLNIFQWREICRGVKRRQS